LAPGTTMMTFSPSAATRMIATPVGVGGPHVELHSGLPQPRESLLGV